MSSPLPDHAVRFALLAHRKGYLDAPALIDALEAWSGDASLRIADVLEARGHLNAETRALLELTARHPDGFQGGLPMELDVSGQPDSMRTRVPENPVLEGLQQLETRPPVEVEVDSHPTRSGDEAETASYTPLGGRTAPTGRPSGDRYRKVQFHAKGGLGAVFVAMDQELSRSVALKEIQERHADHPSNQARFLREAEITGQLEHPCIVPVYGLGTYENGRPFYAMRFIKGESLKEAILQFHNNFSPDPTRKALELRGLLRRFLDVCNAMDYAHSRGVLHRDLKPANVMVGRYGETLVVDWGLARLISDDDPSSPPDNDEPSVRSSSGDSSATRHGDMIGTIGYMSPEQAAGRHEELGPASDVYSLGAILYTILVGHSPLAGLLDSDISRRIHEGDFPAPRAIASTIPKALDAICRKAMAVTSTDRYSSPSDLAADVERWLADEPVSALADPWTARFARWTRRHRSAALAGLLSLLVIAGVSSIAFVMVTRALGDRTRALSDMTRARNDEAAANAKTLAAFRSARTTIDDFLVIVRKDPRLLEKSLGPFRGKLIERILKYTVEFIDKYKEEPLLAQDIASAYENAGYLHRDLGRVRDSLGAHEESLRIRERLSRDHPEDAFQEALAGTLNNVGDRQGEIGRIDDAERSYGRAIGIREAIAKRSPSHAENASGLARLFDSLGELQKLNGQVKAADQNYDRSIELWETLIQRNPESFPDAYQLALVLSKSGVLQIESGRTQAAERRFSRAAERYEVLHKRDADDFDSASGLAITLTRLANLHRDSGRTVTAEPLYARSIVLTESLIARDPSVHRFAEVLADTLNHLGLQQEMTGRDDEAERSYGRSIEIREVQWKRDPDNPRLASLLGMSLINLGAVQRATGRKEAAERTYSRAIELYEPLVKSHPENTYLNNGLAIVFNNLGNLQIDTGRNEAAEASLTRAVAIREGLVQRNPETTDHAHKLAMALSNLAELQNDTGRSEAALGNCLRAKGVRESLLKRHPDLIDVHYGLASTCAIMGHVLIARSRPQESIAAFQEAVAHIKEASDRAPRNTRYSRYLIYCHSQLAEAHLKFGNAKEAAAVSRESREICRNNPSDLYNLARHFSLCIPLGALSEKDRFATEAIETLREAIRAGWSNFARTSKDSDLAPLAGRADFRVLLLEMMDRAFPADPFSVKSAGEKAK